VDSMEMTGITLRFKSDMAASSHEVDTGPGGSRVISKTGDPDAANLR
jgi:hypothetical protein